MLLPVWILSYRHGGKTWPILVHGQTGKVVGKAPLSWVKILMIPVALAAAALAVLVFLALATALGAALG